MLFLLMFILPDLASVVYHSLNSSVYFYERNNVSFIDECFPATRTGALPPTGANHAPWRRKGSRNPSPAPSNNTFCIINRSTAPEPKSQTCSNSDSLLTLHTLVSSSSCNLTPQVSSKSFVKRVSPELLCLQSFDAAQMLQSRPTEASVSVAVAHSSKRMVRGVCGAQNIWCNPPSDVLVKQRFDSKSPSPRREISDKAVVEVINRKSMSPKSRDSLWTGKCSTEHIRNTHSKIRPRKCSGSNEQSNNSNPFGSGGLIDRWGNPISSSSPPHPPRTAKKKLVPRVIKSCSVSPARTDRVKPQLNLTPAIQAVGAACPVPQAVSRRSGGGVCQGDATPCSSLPGTVPLWPFTKLSSGSSSDSGGEGNRDDKKKHLVLHLPPHGGSGASHHHSHHHGETGRDRSHKRCHVCP